MSSPDARPAPSVHVERTDDPAVLRWVCSSPSLHAVAQGQRHPPWSRVAALASVAEVAVVAGALVVRLHDGADWAAEVAAVNDAIVDSLRDRAQWLFDPIDVLPAIIGGATTGAVQRIVDSAAGAITGAHGGSITVVGLDADVVRLRLSGACHGCRFTDDTVRRVIEPAVGRMFPQMTVVVER